MPSYRIAAAAALLAIVAATPAAAQSNASGAVELSNGAKVGQKVTLPKLSLSNAQREQIRKAVASQNSDVEFRLKAVKKAKDFTPQVGAKLPKGVKPLGLPGAVLAKLPQLGDYGYVTMKNQVLLVDALTMKIVDVFSETQPVL